MINSTVGEKCRTSGLWLAMLLLGATACHDTGESVLGEDRAGGEKKSDLWGTEGDKWEPDGRLPDYSYAGYRWAEASIPNPAVVANVKDFGAKGNGSSNDTAAFKAAIAEAKNGAIFVPEGTYKLTDQLVLKRSNVVLRGAGKGKTILKFTKSFDDLGDVPYLDGMIRVEGSTGGSKITKVSNSASRGDYQITVDSTNGLSVGQLVRLRMKNPGNNSLGCEVYADKGCLNDQRRGWYGGKIVDWLVPIEAINGKKVTLARPLRLPIEKQWKPELWTNSPSVKNVGVEKLTIEFPNKNYAGHHDEDGWYGLEFRSVQDAWVRSVEVVDGDVGLSAKGTRRMTVQDFVMATDHRSGSEICHYGMVLGSLSQDILVEDSQIKAKCVHNISVNSFSNGNVYSRIKLASGRLDHHGAAPYENLFTEIVFDNAGDLFKSGGNRSDEPNSGARTTFWNLETKGANFPGFSDKIRFRFPQINIVGVDRWTTKKNGNNEWIEKWEGSKTSPKNLYEAQLAYRLGTDPDPDPDPDPDDGSALTDGSTEISASGQGSGNTGPGNTLDGSLDTRWSSEGSGEWIRFDLGSEKTVKSIDIAWYKGDKRKARFEVQVSDGASGPWSRVYEGESTGNTLDFQSYDVDDEKGRYVRIVGDGNTSNNWNSITEVVVRGS